MDLDYFNSDLLLYYHQYYYFYKFSSRFGGHTFNITYYYHGAPRPDQPTNFYLLLPTKQLRLSSQQQSQIKMVDNNENLITDITPTSLLQDIFHFYTQLWRKVAQLMYNSCCKVSACSPTGRSAVTRGLGKI